MTTINFKNIFPEKCSNLHPTVNGHTNYEGNVDYSRKLHVIFQTYLLLGFRLLNACRCRHHNPSKHQEQLTQ